MAEKEVPPADTKPATGVKAETPQKEEKEVAPADTKPATEAKAESPKKVEKKATTANTLIIPKEQHSVQETFQKHHHHIHWHVDIQVDGHDVYPGFIKEIDHEGTNIYLEHNLQFSKTVKLHIYVPPIANTVPPRIIEVTGKIMSSVHDNEEDTFRSGIHFQQFTREADKTFLLSQLYD